MYIVDAMNKATAAGAVYSFFSQGSWDWGEEGKETDESGQCYALSMYWLMTSAQNKQWPHSEWEENLWGPNDMTEGMREWIVSKQTKLLQGGDAQAQKIAQNRFLKKRGFWPQFEGTKQRSKRISYVNYKFRPEATREQFIRDAAESAVDIESGYVAIAIFFEGKPGLGHELALRRKDQSVLYFDPNGGQLDFKTVTSFKEWFAMYFLEIKEYTETFSFEMDYYTHGIPIKTSHFVLPV